MSVKSKRRHFWKNWNEWNSNPGGPKILSSAIRKNGLVPPVLDSLDNYKILSERMNVLTIYLPQRKFGIASDLRKVKTAV